MIKKVAGWPQVPDAFGMRLPALAALWFAAACGGRARPYQFASPMLGRADVPAEQIAEKPREAKHKSPRTGVAYGWQADSQAGIRTVSARGIEVTMPTASAASAASVAREGSGREIVWSRLPAPHKETGVAITTVHEPADLRSLVGQRDARDPFTIVIDWLGELGIAFDRASASDGPTLVAWADAAGKLHNRDDPPAAGDLLVFDHVDSDSASDRIALVIARDNRGVIEFLYSGGGVIRRGYLDPSRASTRRDLDGSVLNTFLRHGKRWPPKGTRYLAGELVAHVIHLR